jgi:hypothetical protein
LVPPWLAADHLAARLTGLDAEQIYDLAERSAILEYCAGMTRAEAEGEATGGA